MNPAGQHLQHAFRHRPPRVQSDWIPRPRLAARLARRFELDVVVVVAPAGYGKTTALAQAVAANEADPKGTDLWVQCRPADADAEVLAGAIWRAAGLDPSGRAPEAAALVDALLRFAPHPVCLILDDLHTVDPSSEGFALLGALLEHLPDHAHLVLAGRTVPALPLARRRIEGRCEDLGADDLEFDDEELGIAGSPPASGDHARWPALARLARADRPDATVDYLLEEVAAGLGPDRLAALSALSLVGTVDDDLACAASDGGADASELLDDLPLVHRSSDRSIQLHDLWSTALIGSESLDEPTAAAVGRVAAAVRRRGQHREAAELYARAGDAVELERTCVDYVSQPLMFTSAGELQALATLVADVLPGRPIAELLNATVPIVGDEQRSVDAFAEVAANARAAGDPTVETIALQNITNLQGMIDPSALPQEVADRADALAAGGERRARSLQAIVRSFAARAAAEPEACARHLAALDPTTSVVDQTMFAFGMGDLGRPEDVAAPAGETDPTSAAARAGGQYLAQAMWLRGDVSPETALEFGTQLVDVTDSRGVAHVRISTSSVLALVALAAGDV
ncbi:MAG: hypothetical protein KDA97_07530, partial [Acidimicrobiales bacterium]|nr:hypothetical protein [Acidimicrobiales bacterium]